jgi:hypothetical protein
MASAYKLLLGSPGQRATELAMRQHVGFPPIADLQCCGVHASGSYPRQKRGMSRISTVNSSRRPSSMPKQSSHFAAVGSVE